MAKLHTAYINANNCTKEISVFCDDVTDFPETIDILTTSAYVGSYSPAPRTVFKALFEKGIFVQQLAFSPQFDLRKACHVWLSKALRANKTSIKRIGCIELVGNHIKGFGKEDIEQAMITSVSAYFKMLDIASLYGVNMSTIALPLLGSGLQQIPYEMLLVPLINECISFLKRNEDVKKIYFIEKNPEKAILIATALHNSLRFTEASPAPADNEKNDNLVFISYASQDKNIADNLCFKLESKGYKVWYAPRDVKGPYAEAITNAVDRASHFAVILSQNSIKSEHVLNEIDLAFQHLPNHIKFKPLRIDSSDFTPSFRYYLSRQHWMDATDPPLEARLNEFVQTLQN